MTAFVFAMTAIVFAVSMCVLGRTTAFVFANWPRSCLQDVFFKFKSEQVQSGTYLYEEIWSVKYYVDSPRQLEPTPTPREKKGTRVWVEYLCNSICVCVWGTMHLVLCTTYYVPVHSTMYYLPRTSYEVICTVASWYQRYYVRGTWYIVHMYICT